MLLTVHSDNIIKNKTRPKFQWNKHELARNEKTTKMTTVC